MYIGAVAVLPTYAVYLPDACVAFTDEKSTYLLRRLLQESKSGKQALREVSPSLRLWIQ